LVRWRDDVAAVAREEPPYDASRSKRRRRLADLLGFAGPVVGAKPNA
jgi:hypothetical protein